MDSSNFSDSSDASDFSKSSNESTVSVIRVDPKSIRPATGFSDESEELREAMEATTESKLTGESTDDFDVMETSENCSYASVTTTSTSLASVDVVVMLSLTITEPKESLGLTGSKVVQGTINAINDNGKFDKHSDSGSLSDSTEKSTAKENLQRICAGTSTNIPSECEAVNRLREAFGENVLKAIETEKDAHIDQAKLEAGAVKAAKLLEEAKASEAAKALEKAKPIELTEDKHSNNTEATNTSYDTDTIDTSSDTDYLQDATLSQVKPIVINNAAPSETSTHKSTEDVARESSRTTPASKETESTDAILFKTLATDESDTDIGAQSVDFNAFKNNFIHVKPRIGSSYDSSSSARRWVNLSDEEYMAEDTGKHEIEFPIRSVFSYLELQSDQVDLYLVNVPEKGKLLDIATQMLETNEGAYLRVEIASHVFDCNPRLVRLYSAWFAVLQWNVDYVMLDERDVAPKAFRVIYQWMRTQRAIKMKHLAKVMQGAKYLKMDTLIEECWDILADPPVREKQAFQLFWDAGNMPLLDDMRHLILSRVRAYFLPLVASEDFVKLHRDQLIDLLTQTCIGVNSEIEVLFAAVRWIVHNTHDRLPHMQAVMKCIRFIYLPMRILFALRDGTIAAETGVVDTPEYVLLEFHKDQNLRNHLSEAMSFISMELQSDDDADNYSDGFGKRTLVMKRNEPRRWIYFPMCKYHLPRLEYPHSHKITYADFMEFTSSIQLDWMAEAKPV